MVKVSVLLQGTTLLNIHRSLIEPYISYGLVAWGQAANTHLNNVFILQKAGSSSNVFFRLYISQWSSFCLFGNSTNKNALLQIGCLSVTWHRKPSCSSQYFWTFYSLWTGLFLLYSFLSSWKLLHKQARTDHQLLSFSRTSRVGHEHLRKLTTDIYMGSWRNDDILGTRGFSRARRTEMTRRGRRGGGVT